MIDHLSVSQINTFLRCGKQWEYRYVYGLKIPPKGLMVVGSCYHQGLASGFQHKLNTGENPILELVLDAYDSKWANIRAEHRLLDEGETLPFDTIEWEGNPGELKDTGIELLKLYQISVALKLTPETVEERQTLDVDGVQLVLIPDLITDSKIIDHKVKAKRFSQDELNQDLQSTCYFLKNKKPFEFHIALRQVKPAIEIMGTERTEKDTNFFTELVSKVWKSIQTGVFVPRPVGYQCSERWCGYWKICRGKK